jgi:hypothetical protein
VARGQYPQAEGNEEGWIRRRLTQHLSQNSAIEQNLPDGRWIKITENRTPEGGIVGLRVDITDFKRAQQQAEAAARSSTEGLNRPARVQPA